MITSRGNWTPRLAGCFLRGGCRTVSNVGQEHHPLPGGWWRAMGGRRRWQCAQCPVLGTAYHGRCDTQGGHDVRGGYSGHGPQQDDLAVRGGQRGAQRTEPGALTGVDCVLAGICGSGRWEERRWRYRCTPAQGSATAWTGRRTHSPNPRLGLRLPVVGFGGAVAHRSLCRPARECPPRRAERWEPAGWHRRDIRAACDLRCRDDPGIGMSPPRVGARRGSPSSG